MLIEETEIALVKIDITKQINEIEAKESSMAVSVNLINGEPFVTFLCPRGSLPAKYKIHVKMTGQEVPFSGFYYVGTLILEGGLKVRHIFIEKNESTPVPSADIS